MKTKERIQDFFTQEEWGLLFEGIVYRFGMGNGHDGMMRKLLTMKLLSSPEKKEEVETLEKYDKSVVQLWKNASNEVEEQEWETRLENLVKERWGEEYIGTHPYNEMYDICKEIISKNEVEKEEPTRELTSSATSYNQEVDKCIGFTKEELEAIKEQVEGSWGAGTYFRKFISVNNSILSKIEKMLK